MREKELFSQTMIEFFAPIENQRYILKAQEKVSDQTEYFAVPSLFDKRKEGRPKPLSSKSERV